MTIDYKTLYDETKTLTVLLVEDFEPLCREISDVLEDLFYKVTCANNGREALALYQNNHASFDVVISDIQMPYMNGVTLAKEMRQLNQNQVILMLSAHTDSEYLLELINIGISKFITKPIDYDMLFSYLYKECHNLNAQKPQKEHREVIDLGESYVWYAKTRLLKYKDINVELTKHELLLLEFFLERVEHLCSNEEIIETFFRHEIEMSEKNIRNLIFKLRKKIPEACIQSVYGLGYKFVLLKA